MGTESLPGWLLNVESVHELAVIAPLAELLDVVVALLGDLGGCLAWAACTSFLSCFYPSSAVLEGPEVFQRSLVKLVSD